MQFNDKKLDPSAKYDNKTMLMTKKTGYSKDPMMDGELSSIHDAVAAIGRGEVIIVVDDDADVRQVLSNLLSHEHEVDLFQSGPEVLEHFSRGCCEVVAAGAAAWSGR